MSRVIKTESAGKDRTRLVNAIVLALRELMQQPEPDVLSRDLAAFIALALNMIHATIDQSVNAWEKRGYWVKADRFRMEWEWTERTSAQLREALISDDWAAVAIISAQVGQRFSNVNIPVRNRIGKPWVGAWNVLQNKPGV
ncbi:MAG: hypothetical protein U1B80_02380 [Anaerolineaceae bacterium]|nr:hypothetical protein [Anaerolineaceae bacterium]